MNPEVSIIIPIIRNDPHIQECVEAIKQSWYKNYEIIIVDEGLERSAQRNIGIKRANGKYILYLDSDMMIQPDLITDCLRKIQDNIGVYIPERISTEGWFGRLRDWERQFYTGTLVDVCRFVRKKDCPLFNESMHGVEDSDWERRLIGKKSISTSYFNHHDKCGLIKYLKKKAYYAQSLSLYRQKNPEDKLLTFKYRCWTVFTENGKYKILLRHPIKTFEVMLLLLARGIIAIWVEKFS